MTLRQAVARLCAHYGQPAPPPVTDPFALVLWENVAYLANPVRRREAFEMLVHAVGTTPQAIATAPAAVLEQAGAKGILKKDSARKLRECARIAIADFGGDLAGVVAGDVPTAVRALMTFPGIGRPGAEKILLFAGRHASLAPESNGLRVLMRLTLVPDGRPYAATYAAGQAAGAGLPRTLRAMQDAHLLLRQHGETCCRRTNPACVTCPLASSCPFPARP